MSETPRVVSDPEVMMGKPVIAGTRITVELILEKLAAGESIDQIVQSHPRLRREAVLVAIDFVRTLLLSDEVHLISPAADDAVVASARAAVELVLRELAVGKSVEQIVSEHPKLTREGVMAALEYAKEMLRPDAPYPTSAAKAAFSAFTPPAIRSAQSQTRGLKR